jgi:hypothetical protein
MAWTMREFIASNSCSSFAHAAAGASHRLAVSTLMSPPARFTMRRTTAGCAGWPCGVNDHCAAAPGSFTSVQSSDRVTMVPAPSRADSAASALATSA